MLFVEGVNFLEEIKCRVPPRMAGFLRLERSEEINSKNIGCLYSTFVQKELVLVLLIMSCIMLSARSDYMYKFVRSIWVQ